LSERQLEEKVGDFRKLEVWQKSQTLVASVYKLTGAFPLRERYGLALKCAVQLYPFGKPRRRLRPHGDIELRRSSHPVWARSQNLNASCFCR